MKTVPNAALAAAIAATAVLSATTAAQAGNAGVNIIYPPKLETAKKVAEPAAKPAKNSVTIHVHTHTPDYRKFWRAYHRFRVNRALFQRYHMDRPRYGGKRYPF